MRNTTTVLFYLRKSRINSQGLVPVYLRVTVNNQRIDLTTNRFVNADKWISSSGTLKGNSEEARTINTYLSTLKTKVYKHINTLELQSLEVTQESLKSFLIGDHASSRSLIQLINYHNDRMKNLIGKDYAKGTHKHFKAMLKKVEGFLNTEYRKKDILLSQLDHAFITKFEYYLKTHDELENNTAMNYIKRLKKMIHIALQFEWIETDPFIRFKCSYDDTNRGFLTQDELEKLMNKDFEIERIKQVRDIFIFSCFTGLSYADIEKLEPKDVSIGMDREKWITIFRHKTDTRSSIPLLPQAIGIINKYKDNPLVINRGKLLPVISNQKMNAYLKEIADAVGINKNLTFHMARHTFATTVTLSNNVPIETVSVMLGHKSIKTTQIYSKVVDSKVSHDMSTLKMTLSKKARELSKKALTA